MLHGLDHRCDTLALANLRSMTDFPHKKALKFHVTAPEAAKSSAVCPGPWYHAASI
jgi:hypothetical protein